MVQKLRATEDRQHILENMANDPIPLNASKSVLFLIFMRAQNYGKFKKL